MNLYAKVFIHKIIYITNDGTYVVNIDNYKSLGAHRIALYMNDNNATCFNSFWFEDLPEEINNL